MGGNFFPGLDAGTGRWWWIVPAGCLSGVALALRRPDALLNPQFWAEDGNVFFAQQFYGEASIFRPYSGYLHVVPRLVAWMADFFPVVQAPLIYNLAALILSSICCAWFVLPVFGHIVRDHRLRLLACLLLAAMAGADTVILNLTNVQWYLAVWAALVSLQPLPRGLGKYPLLAAYFLALLSAPMTLVLTPLWGLRAFFWREDRAVCAGTAAAQIGYAVWIHAHSESIGQSIRLFDVLGPALKLAVSRIGLMILAGPDLLGRQNQEALIGFGLVFLILLIIMVIRGKSRRSFLLRTAVMLYLAISSIVIFLVLKDIDTPAQELYFSVGGARYFFLGAAAFQVWLVGVADDFRSDPVVRIPAALCLVLVVLVSGRYFLYVPRFENTNWPRWAEGLEQARMSGTRFIFDVPVNPRPWTIPGSRQLPADTRSVEVTPTPVKITGLTPSGNEWEPLGPRSSLTFAPDQPAYIYGILMTYKLEINGAATARLSWRTRPDSAFISDRSITALPSTGNHSEERTLWVLDRVTEFRIEFKGTDFSFSLLKIGMLVSPHPAK